MFEVFSNIASIYERVDIEIIVHVPTSKSNGFVEKYHQNFCNFSCLAILYFTLMRKNAGKSNNESNKIPIWARFSISM